MSAKYHLLQPGIEIEACDETLKGKKAKEQKEWAVKVFEQIKKELPNHERYELFFHGGNEYKKYLIPMYQKGGYNCHVPLEGKKIGKQMTSMMNATERNPS